jgi:hypothetical protein
MAVSDIGSILGTMQAVERVSLKDDSETVCRNPLCSTRFPEGGMPQSPKRFCSDACLQQASLIRRVAALLVPLGKEKAWEALSKIRG